MTNTYKIIEENKENPLETKIEIGGLTNETTVQAILDHQMFTEKTKKEAVAQIEVHVAQDKLALDLYPKLKTLPKDKYQIILAWIQRYQENPQLEALIKACDETLDAYNAKLVEIAEATGIAQEAKKAPEVVEAKEITKD
jgi:hypothetical protein